MIECIYEIEYLNKYVVDHINIIDKDIIYTTNSMKIILKNINIIGNSTTEYVNTHQFIEKTILLPFNIYVKNHQMIDIDLQILLPYITLFNFIGDDISIQNNNLIKIQYNKNLLKYNN